MLIIINRTCFLTVWKSRWFYWLTMSRFDPILPKVDFSPTFFDHMMSFLNADWSQLSSCIPKMHNKWGAVHISKCSKFKLSQSILLFSPVSVNEFLIPLVDLFRRTIYTKYINLVIFCSVIAEVHCFKVETKSKSFFKMSCDLVIHFNFSKNYFFQSIWQIFFRISHKATFIYTS